MVDIYIYIYSYTYIYIYIYTYICANCGACIRYCVRTYLLYGAEAGAPAEGGQLKVGNAYIQEAIGNRQ